MTADDPSIGLETGGPSPSQQSGAPCSPPLVIRLHFHPCSPLLFIQFHHTISQPSFKGAGHNPISRTLYLLFALKWTSFPRCAHGSLPLPGFTQTLGVAHLIT